MKTLVIALYAEGRTDERFLPILVQRTAESILIKKAESPVDVLEPLIIEPDHDVSKREDKILSVAKKAAGYHAIIIHADADHPDRNRAFEERFQPGYEQVKRIRQIEQVCENLLPLIPVQMIEAWMLADVEALRNIIGTNLTAEQLDLPTRTHTIEDNTNPKQTLQAALKKAQLNRPKRRRSIDWEDLHTSLAKQINLEKLINLPSYKQFVNDLTDLLTQLRLLAQE